MASTAVSRPPDILIRAAPALSATADAPLEQAPRPPISASNHADDQDAGIPAEMTLEEKAAADAARTTPALSDNNPKKRPAFGHAWRAPTEREGSDWHEPGSEPGREPAAKPGDKPAAESQNATEDDDVDVSDLPPETQAFAVREISNARKAARAKVREATAAADAARAAAEAAQAELAEMRAKIADARPAEPPKLDPRPTRDGFDDPDSYDSALTDWAEREGARKAEAKIAAEAAAARAAQETAGQAAQAAAAEAQREALNADWTAKRAAATAKYPDYIAVAEGDHPVSMPMAEAIMRADNGADIAYYLGKNPEESARIAALPYFASQITEIGKISAQLAAPQSRRTRSRPIEPVESGAAPADIGTREPSMDEWGAKRTKEILSARRPFFQVAEQIANRR